MYDFFYPAFSGRILPGGTLREKSGAVFKSLCGKTDSTVEACT